MEASLSNSPSNPIAYRPRLALGICHILIGAVLMLNTGCMAIRLTDYRIGSIRFLKPSNSPVPDQQDSEVYGTLLDWKKLPDARADLSSSPDAPAIEGDKRVYPTPYHLYVDAPLGGFGFREGNKRVGLAFSGGGTRAAVFGAYCLEELEQLDLENSKRWDEYERPESVLGEVDYVSGVSGGTFIATRFVLEHRNYRRYRPGNRLFFSRWGGDFNKDLFWKAFRRPFVQPLEAYGTNFLLFAYATVFNYDFRPLLMRTYQSEFLDSYAGDAREWTTFRDLPGHPSLMLSTTVVDEPGIDLIQTRIPYRYAKRSFSNQPNEFRTQTFETFHNDPMDYRLAEAMYNSSSFPGLLRSGVVKAFNDASWPVESAPPDNRYSMAEARSQNHLSGIYELKDGGYYDNLGARAVLELLVSSDVRNYAARYDSTFPELKSRVRQLMVIGGGYETGSSAWESDEASGIPELEVMTKSQALWDTSREDRESSKLSSLASQPLLIIVDASNSEISPPKAAKKASFSYLGYFYGQMEGLARDASTIWRLSQISQTELIDRMARENKIAVIPLRLNEYTKVLGNRSSPGYERLRFLCAKEGDVQTVPEFEKTMQTLKTDINNFSARQEAAIRIAAAYAVYANQVGLLQWRATNIP